MAVAKLLFFDLPGFGRVKAFDGSIKLAGVRREGTIADTGPTGPDEEPVYGELSFKIRNTPDISMQALADLVGINVTVQDDAGKTWLCTGAFITEPPTLSSGEIDIAMQFENQEELS